jgi:hypothetical protein
MCNNSTASSKSNSQKPTTATIHNTEHKQKQVITNFTPLYSATHQYFGLSGQLQFDANGKTRSASTTWWNIDGTFKSVQQSSECAQVD